MFRFDTLSLKIQMSTITDMRFSEVLLRLGCHLVGWLIIYSHCIWLGLIPQIGCGPEGEELYRLSLGFSPLVIGAALLLGLANKLTSVVAYLKWMAVPLILLVPLTAIPILTALETTTVGGMGFCDSVTATNWQRSWAPIQIVTIAIVLIAAVRFVIKRTQVVD